MNSNAHFEIGRNFRRTEITAPKNHPVRAKMLSPSERELLHHEQLEIDGQRSSKLLTSDIAVMMMGIISAFVPIVIAFTTMMGN
jgi:hypothetical protein